MGRRILLGIILALTLLTFTAAESVLLEEGLLGEEMEGVDGAPQEVEVTEESDSPRPLRRRGVERPSRLSYGGREEVLPRIPGVDRELTQEYIRRYSSPGGIRWINETLRRGALYMGHISREIRQRELPPELLCLPMIESSFLETARSHSGAAGLWQFMANSIAPFNMKISDSVDERMDFWKATDGALRKLEENRDRLDDWPMALAAYNAGMGAVNRIIREQGTGDYWELSGRGALKRETIHYVPQILAVYYILSNPRQFGLDIPWIKDPFWVRIAPQRQVDLELLAAEAGLDPVVLREANSELRQGISPPGKDYLLKLPWDYAAQIRAVLANPDLILMRFYLHPIRSGDTLSALALRYGVTVDQILSLNPGTEARTLRIGQQLRIPIGPRAPAAEPAGSIGASPVFAGTHRVQRGETLWSIARSYAVNMEALAEANGMAIDEILREGRLLKTPIRSGAGR
jgi:membrane-bound lytic murein transglycosylase D